MLAIPARRAETLKARAYDGQLARVLLPPGATPAWVQSVADPALPNHLQPNGATIPQANELAMVGQRKTASPDQVDLNQLPGSDRKLIIDVIGGHLERDSVEAVKGIVKEQDA